MKSSNNQFIDEVVALILGQPPSESKSKAKQVSFQKNDFLSLFVDRMKPTARLANCLLQLLIIRLSILKPNHNSV
ncbi:MAG: hypothetical protein NT073_06545 [Spirosoma sp.]|nr:hypothetical protein [Spirosoma sp.]